MSDPSASNDDPSAPGPELPVEGRVSGPEMTRRTLLRRAGLAVAGVSAFNLAGSVALAAGAAGAGAAARKAAPKPVTTGELVFLNRFPRLMHEYFGQRVAAQERATEATRAGIRTREQAEAFIRARAEQVKRCFGPLPEKTPLNARITRKVERDAYTIENVIFESRPGFPVTGNLYLPKGGRFPRAAVVGVCGHSENGKAGGTYQAFAQGLARLGYIAFLIDPAGQGERHQYLDADLKPSLRWSTSEHLSVGNQQLLVGEVFGTWQAWDGIRAFDYLLTRAEVDPRQVLVTGNSGGGTITTWMCALEPRIAAAAPSCFINTFRRMFESEQPADTEQCPPHVLAQGLDHSDFFLPYLPRPLILLGQERDSFDARGLEQSYGHLRRLYDLVGASDHLALFIGPDAHGYSQPNREAMYGWFNRVTGLAASAREPKLTLEPDQVLWCTPRGQLEPAAARTVFSFTNELARTLRDRRRGLAGEPLKRAVADVLRLPARAGVPDYRILPAPPARRYPKRWAGNYAVETEPGILNLVYRLSDIALVSRPPRGPRRAILYVSHQSADAELRDEPLVRQLAAEEPAAAFYACDLRGVGESQPNTTNKPFLDPYGSDYFYAIYGVMFDHSYPAQRTFDLLRLIDWLRSHGHEEIHLAGKGWGAIPATFAALLHDDVKRVTFRHALTSYRAVAEAAEYDWPLSSFVPDVLKTFDLPDCYAALADKGLRQLDPKGPVAQIA